ncbi:MAG: SDR family oxidoreductase [Bauldia sp.]
MKGASQSPGGAQAHVLILGMGYSGRAIAAALRGHGVEDVVGTTRAWDREAEGTLPFDGKTASRELLTTLGRATHLIVSIPPDESGDPTLRSLGGAIAAAPHLTWIGYLSTVGVYGDHGGDWIDEGSECRPGSERSRARLASEREWQALAKHAGLPIALFRLAGIYGPGRSPLDNVAAGTAHRVVKAGQVFNRIHVDDLAAVVVAALLGSRAGIFNVADDEPAPPQDVVAHAAELLAVEAPPEVPFAEADLSPMARSFYGENKRVRNDRIKRDLGVVLAYPTYREGLAALLRDRGR